MERKDIEHLAKLSRIAVTDNEADVLAASITDILGYVSDIEAITSSGALEKEVGPLCNVMRDDGEPHAPGMYTNALLRTAPKTHGQYIEVKKILAGKKTDRN
jgi:aspartyl-tRNA(Asn)/glutamyl-tRNA(Gln) amidotransferase subunit C